MIHRVVRTYFAGRGEFVSGEARPIGLSFVLLCAASVIQQAGLVAERRFFFAEAPHPRNLHYRQAHERVPQRACALVTFVAANISRMPVVTGASQKRSVADANTFRRLAISRSRLHGIKTSWRVHSPPPVDEE
jgi:hypothetical protein